MEELRSGFALLQAGVVPAVLVGVTLWNSDKVISEAGARVLYDKIEQTSDDPSRSAIAEIVERFLNRYFSFHDGTGRFLLNVLLLTAVSLLVFLSIYTYKTRGLFEQLLTPGFIRQFLGNGFVVTFLVNLFVLYSYRFLVSSLVHGSALANLLIVLADLTVKVLLFIFLTVITYLWFAEFRNAFGGNPIAALRAAPVTIANAILFKNLTSVYMYSLLLSSFPIFVVVLIKVLAVDPKAARTFRALLFWLPFKSKPLRAISTVFAIFCGVLAVLTSLLTGSLRML